MSWTDIACLFLVIAGIILFLFGSNFYSSVSGWAGISLFVVGVLLYVVLRSFRISTGK